MLLEHFLSMPEKSARPVHFLRIDAGLTVKAEILCAFGGTGGHITEDSDNPAGLIPGATKQTNDT